MPLILGLDPGLGTTGWGLIRALSSGLSYRRMSERNRLAFRIPLPGAQDDGA